MTMTLGSSRRHQIQLSCSLGRQTHYHHSSRWRNQHPIQLLFPLIITGSSLHLDQSRKYKNWWLKRAILTRMQIVLISKIVTNLQGLWVNSRRNSSVPWSISIKAPKLSNIDPSEDQSNPWKLRNVPEQRIVHRRKRVEEWKERWSLQCKDPRTVKSINLPCI